jgi:hypothetical protein
MFGFFRSSNEKLYINPQYWREKVLSEDKSGKCVKFSMDIVKEIFENAIRDHYESKLESNEECDKKIKECLNDITKDIIINVFDDSPHFEFYKSKK